MAMPDSVSDMRNAVSSALWSCAAARVDCAFRAFPAARQAGTAVPVVLVAVPGSAIYIRFRVRYQSLGLPNDIALNCYYWLSLEANNRQGRP
jgi:hypothetical protein